MMIRYIQQAMRQHWLLVIIVLFAGCMGGTRSGSPDPSLPDDAYLLQTHFEPSDVAGIALYSVHASDRIALFVRGEFQWDADDYAPLHMALFLPNGSVVPIITGHDFDNAQLGTGDGSAYAGTGNASWYSPEVTTTTTLVNQYAIEPSVDVPEAVLAIMWSDPVGPLWFDLYGAGGVTITPLVTTPLVAIELREQGGGTRIGTPGLVASLGDRLELGAAGSDTLGYIVVIAGGASNGDLQLKGAAATHSISVRPNEPLRTGEYSITRHYFEMDGPVTLDTTIVADGRTRVFVVAGPVLPALLRPVWSTWDESPEAPPGG